MKRRFIASSLAALASLAGYGRAMSTSTGQSGDTLIQPTVPPIVFYWSTHDDKFQTIPQCGGFQVSTYNNTGAFAKPEPPYYFSAFPIGLEPRATLLESERIGDWFTWIAAYPIGTQMSLAMTDSANHSGGLVSGFTIVPGYNNCTVFQKPDSPEVSFTAYPENNACDEVILTIDGGEAPFTVSVLAGQSGQYANVTDHHSRTVKLRNTVPAGQSFYLFVTDAQGVSSIVSSAMTSSLNFASCNPATLPDTDSPTPTGAIAGGVVGGVVAAVLLGLLAWWLVRRRNRRQAEHRDSGSGLNLHGQKKRKRPSVTTTANGSTLPRFDDDEFGGDSPQYSDSHGHGSFIKYPLPHDASQYGAVPTPTALSGHSLVMPPAFDPAALHAYGGGYDSYASPVHTPSYSASSGAQAVEGGGFGSYDPMSAVSHTGSATSGSRAGSYDPNMPIYNPTAMPPPAQLPPESSSPAPSPSPSSPAPAGGIEELARPEEFEYRTGDSPTRPQQYAAAPWHQHPSPSAGTPYGGYATPPHPQVLHSQSSQASMVSPGARMYP